MNVNDKFLLHCSADSPSEHTVTSVNTYSDAPTRYWYTPDCQCGYDTIPENAPAFRKERTPCQN